VEDGTAWPWGHTYNDQTEKIIGIPLLSRHAISTSDSKRRYPAAVPGRRQAMPSIRISGVPSFSSLSPSLDTPSPSFFRDAGP
jgi:hypothetical protein